MVTVEVLNAVVDGKVQGEKLKVDKRSADALVKIGYVKVLSQAEGKKGPSEPKKPVAKKTKPKKSATKKEVTKVDKDK